MCSGGIHDSGRRPAINSSRRCRASARSLLARFLFPRRAAVSAGSARCTAAPTRRSSSTTNRQPGRRLQRDLELLATKALTEPPHPSTVRRRDPRPRDLARVGIDPLRGDLRSMLIKSHYDRHLGPPQAPRLQRPARTSSAHELRRSLQASPDGCCSCHLSSHARGSSGGGGRHGKSRSDPKVDRRIESQPAAVREPNRRAGQHRPPNVRFSLSRIRGAGPARARHLLCASRGTSIACRR